MPLKCVETRVRSLRVPFCRRLLFYFQTAEKSLTVVINMHRGILGLKEKQASVASSDSLQTVFVRFKYRRAAYRQRCCARLVPVSQLTDRTR